MENEQKGTVWPPYLKTALATLRPPERLTVSEWAQNRRILGEATSAEPGPWRNQRTPYLVGIMDSFNDPLVEEIIFVKPTQVGGTEALLNMLGYIIEQDPGPSLIVNPTQKLGEYTMKNRVIPTIRACPSLARRYIEESSNMLELQFTTSMYIAMSGANSSSDLASKAIRFLFMDEVDKYPPCSGKESDPRSLARERTKNFINRICL